MQSTLNTSTRKKKKKCSSSRFHISGGVGGPLCRQDGVGTLPPSDEAVPFKVALVPR